MKNCILIPVLLIVVAFSQEIYSATRLSLIRSTKDFTHKWVYLPSGEDMTRDGIKNNMYPLVLTPVETSLQSEPINIEGQDLGVTIRYSVTTLLTSAIKFELIDENGAVLYSYIENGHEINEETMTVGDTHDIGIIEGAKKVQIRLSLSKAVKNDEAINLNELELFSNNDAGVSSIMESQIKLLSNNGELLIDSPIDTQIQIYALDGRLIKQNAICIGTNRINLFKGLYLVNIGGGVYKIVVH